MAFELRETRSIEAPPAVVWGVIADLPRYGEWNPFVVRARSSLEVGHPISMGVRLLPGLVQPQRETILACDPGELLAYGVTGIPWNALRSLREHRLRADGPARTHYVSHFRLEGWLVPLVRALLERRLETGFRAATRALADRSEALFRDHPG